MYVRLRILYGEINEAAILSTSSDPISILTPSILSDILKLNGIRYCTARSVKTH